MLYLRAREFDRRLQKKSKIEFLFPHKQQNVGEKEQARPISHSFPEPPSRARPISLPLSLSLCCVVRVVNFSSPSRLMRRVTRAKREEKTTQSLLSFFVAKNAEWIFRV